MLPRFYHPVSALNDGKPKLAVTLSSPLQADCPKTLSNPEEIYEHNQIH